MKKFSIKSLVVLMLVLVLCLSLVACGEKKPQTPPDEPGDECTQHIDENGDKKCDECGKRFTCRHKDSDGDGACDKCFAPMDEEPDTPGDSYNAAQFFQGLWDSAAPIGQTAIDEDEDVALELGLNLAIGKGDDTLLDLGIELGIVLDRTNDGENSAARVKLYDHDHEENWITIYFFLNDPYYAYVDWADQHLKIGMDFGFNNTWAETINGFVGTPILGDMSIADLLESITSDFGKNWNLDGLINSLTGLLGLNLGELLTSGTVADLLPMINNVLASLADNLGIEDYEGLDVDKLAESDAIVLDLLKAVGPILFSETSVVEDGNTATYKAGLDFGPNGILGSVMPLLGGMLPAGIGDLLNSVNELAFEYTAVDGEIDNFAILVGVDTDDEPLSVEIGFNEISITGVDAADADEVFDMDKSDYEGEYAIDLALDVDITEGALVLFGNDLAGDYRLQVTGMVDLLNAEDNNSVLEVKITDGKAVLARATYVDGTLAAEFDAENAKVQLVLGEIGPMIVNAFATAVRPDGTPDELLQEVAVELANAIYTTDFASAAAIAEAYQTKHNGGTSVFTVDSAFKGVALTDIKLVKLFTGLFGGAPSFGTASATDVINWSPDILAILTLASEAFDGNIKDGLTITAEEIGETITSLFGKNNGPQNTDEFCYGNGKGVVGLFEKVTGEEFTYDATGAVTGHTIESSDRGAENEEWFASVVGESDWAEEGRVIASVFESDVELFVQINDGTAQLKVTVENGSDSIVIGITAKVTAGEAPEITAVDTEGLVSFAIIA
jgi:predicted small lipoprotein YifL